jgi:membrane-associated phospholipid phosphatase
VSVRRLTGIDLATLAYVGLATVAVLRPVSGEAVPGRASLLAAHALLVALVMLAPRARAAGQIGRFLGEWYPLLLLPGLYGEVHVLTVGAGFQNERSIQQLEAWVFGSQVSYRWIREQPHRFLSWILHICYLAYYPILYGSPLGLWLGGRRDASRHTIFAIMVTFYLCYAGFLFFPVAGPRYAFDTAHNAATQVWPARLAAGLIDHGDSWGAAFPSSHVAAAAVATGMALRYWRRLGRTLLPFTTGLIPATVYGQFHYAVDALAGLAVAALVLVVMQTAEARAPRHAPADLRGESSRLT